MKFCVICWEETDADGAGFFCKNCSKDLGVGKIGGLVWLGPNLVFDTETADVIESYDEPGVPVI